MSHKVTHNVSPWSQFLPPCCAATSPTHLLLVPFSPPSHSYHSSLSPLSHLSVISLSSGLSSLVHNFADSLGRVTVSIGVQDWIFLGRGSILGAVLQRIIHVQILCDTQKRARSITLSTSLLRSSTLGCLPQNDSADTIWVPPSSPPRCPLDLCQTREQTRNGCMPKYSGKESKQHICWVEKRSEMPWCLKGSAVVWRSKVQTHSMRWDTESLGAVLGEGQMWVTMGYSVWKEAQQFLKDWK